MASFSKYKTKNKGELWLFKIDVGKDPATGERKSTTKRGFKTKKEAQLAAAEIEREVADGVYSPESNITFDKFSEDWLKEYKLRVKKSTFKTRDLWTRKVLRNKFGALRMKDITRKQYQDMLNELGNTYADGTITIIHSVGKLIFKKAIEYDIIKNDPTEYSKIIRKKKTIEELEQGELPKYMEKEELSVFLQTAKYERSHQDYLLYLILAYTGMRIGELLALKWKDVSFEQQTINITKTCYFEDHNTMKFELLPPKTKASTREIVIDDLVIAELRKHQFHQNNVRMHPASPFIDHGFIFTSDKHPGYPYNIVTAQYKMKSILLKSGINSDLSPHSLRHTHTSLLAEAGVELTEIMERLGHEDDSVTKRVYLHVTKTKRLAAANKFSELMKNIGAVNPRSRVKSIR